MHYKNNRGKGYFYVKGFNLGKEFQTLLTFDQLKKLVSAVDDDVFIDAYISGFIDGCYSGRDS